MPDLVIAVCAGSCATLAVFMAGEGCAKFPVRRCFYLSQLGVSDILNYSLFAHTLQLKCSLQPVHLRSALGHAKISLPKL